MAGTGASVAEFRAPPWAGPVAGAGFGLALLALLVADLDAAVRGALLGAYVVAAVAAHRELRRTSRTRALAWDGRGGWTLDAAPVSVAPATRVYPGLVVLVLREVRGARGMYVTPTGVGGAPTVPAASPGPWLGRSGGRSVHWVPRSAAAPDAFRRLKQQLRHGRDAAAAEPPENTPC